MQTLMIMAGNVFTFFLAFLAGFYLFLVIGFWVANVNSQEGGSPYP
jgi:hypothetical protein